MLVSRIINVKKLERENSILRKKLSRQYSFQDILSKNSKMREIFELIREVASLRSTVLIEGESGTGKELIARATHFAGDRASKPFIGVSCAALAETLLESELFGHEKGSFTGASAQKKGKFELADGGTIFLDEIGISLRSCRWICCGFCRSVAFTGSEAGRKSRWMCASSPPPTQTSRMRF